jgi:uncharacterized membrane protein YidH (DUF202 family)
MKKIGAGLLQCAIVLIAAGALTFMLWEPHLEGRNANATTFEVYFRDPFLAYVYVGSIAFYVGLYRAFGLFGHLRRTGRFSQVTVDALRSIKRCALTVIGFVLGAIVFFIGFIDPASDDGPQGIVMSLFVILVSSAVAATASVSARKLKVSLKRSDSVA